MNKYNIGDTVYYNHTTGILKGEIRCIYTHEKYGIVYNLKGAFLDYKEKELYRTKEELLEWLKTTGE